MGSDGPSDERSPEDTSDASHEGPGNESNGGESPREPNDGESPSESNGGDSPEHDTPGDAEDESDPVEFESYYDLLGVPADATTEEIERAYRELAKRHHPDVSDRPEREAERRFQQLLAARDVLTNVERRRAYDELGHEEYRRQSSALGEPVAGVDRESSPEPRPEPGQAQRSARGEAHQRGEPLVTSTEEAFPDDPLAGTEGREQADDDAGADREVATGRGVYRLVVEDRPPESRSLQYVGARWATSWRNRAAVGAGSVLLVAVGLAGLSAGLDAVGVGTSTPGATAGRLYLVALAAVLASTAYSCAVTELRLPRGQFLADRDHGRFSMATSRTYQRRGAVALVLVLALAATSAQGGSHPWSHTAALLGGDLSGPFPWFDPPASLSGWTTAIDILVTGVFALAAVAGSLLVSLGASIALWRARYEHGRRLRPSLWEPVFALTVVSVLFALVAGPVALGSVSLLTTLPESVGAAAAIDGPTITVATVAVAGIVLSLVGLSLLRLRLALIADKQATEEGTVASDSG